MSASELALLIVDDDDVDLERTRRVVSRCGLPIRIEEASSGAEAVAMAESARYDCILLDYRLDDMTALDVLPRVCGGTEGPPVIVLTAVGDERVAVEAMKLGASDYLRKSDIHPDSFAATLRGTLAKRELQIELADAQRKLETLSLYDGLTGLPNRHLFLDRLEQNVLRAGRGGGRFAVFMMDLNRFKQVNDTLGHDVGDRLLALVGERLEAAARNSDTVARLGGDEFAAILPGVDSAEAAAVVAEKLCSSVARDAVLGEHVVSVGLSLGIALFPEHGDDGDRLLKRADEAMYEAKRGGGGFLVWAPANTRSARDEPVTATRLRTAIDADEFVLHYQPKVNLLTREVIEFEALVRWNHPELGFLPPMRFIPSAERSNAIVPLTYAILDRALDQAVAWHAAGAAFSVAVNVSPRIFDEDSLARRITDALAARSLPSDTLTVEITESGLMTCPDRARAVVEALSGHGVGIAIDDFGTGFTSLRYLRDFAISEIKIDRVFVDALRSGSRDASIVHSIVELARGFGVRTVAEGIETQESWRTLLELGCGLGQGFAIGRPMEAGDVEAWTRHWLADAPQPAVRAPARRVVAASA